MKTIIELFGIVLGFLFLTLFYLALTAGPVVVIVWVIWKLFFN
jgi:hypothetical protein